jgi:hypothetical protein
MPIEVWEAPESPMLTYADPNGQGTASAKAKFYARGSEDRAAIKSAVETLISTSISAGGQLLTYSELELEWLGPDGFSATANYVSEKDEDSQQQPTPGTWKFHWDTTGGTQLITQAIGAGTRGERSMSRPAPDLLRAIGWDGKKVHGCEIVIPKLEFTVTATYAYTAITTAFVANLARATGKINDATWQGFAAGELLFLGSSGAKDLPTSYGTRTQPVDVELKFSASENRSSITLTPGMVTGAKKGWDRLSVVYREEVDATTGLVRAVPEHWYIDPVYDETGFAALFGF